jgi:hypothetical protein
MEGGQAVSDHFADTNKMVGRTLRTDTLLIAWDMTPEPKVLLDHARQLECELNAANERLGRLESWIADLEQVAAHSGKSDNREWFGPEIGWLHPGYVAYIGEARP